MPNFPSKRKSLKRKPRTHRAQARRANGLYLWQKPWSADETLDTLKELALMHAKQGGEQGKRIANCIVSGDFLSLCNFDLSYETSDSAEQLGHARQALGFFSKLDFIDLGIDPEAVAKDSWLRAESECRYTNACFEAYEKGDFQFLPSVSSILHGVQRKISQVLGKAPTFTELQYRFGPGATTLTKKRMASAVEKLQAGISCSEDLLPYASRIMEEMPHLSELHSLESSDDVMWLVNIMIHDEYVRFVSKTAKTKRAISVPPSLNSMVQLAIGDIMSDCLAAVGVDLKDQTLNQRLAREGSIDGSKATIDLTSASDMQAYRLIAYLLPFDWYIALTSCRCSYTVLDGERVLLEKFSSQGNGYTFPLETLVFWAICSVVSNHEFVSVYGDDIIVKEEYFEASMTALRMFGFVPNPKKSFGTGKFRESCGADYYDGINIRPYYQKELLSWAEIFKIHNYYVRTGNDTMAAFVLQKIPEFIRLFGPDGYGDGHLVGHYSLFLPEKDRKRGFGGGFFHTYKYDTVYDERMNRKGDPVLPLYSAYRGNPEPEFSSKQLASIKSRDLVSYLRIVRDLRKAPDGLREVIRDGEVVKTPTFPGKGHVKIIKIYTFDRPSL